MCRSLIVIGDTSKQNQSDYLRLNFIAIRGLEFQYVRFTKLQFFFEHLPLQQLESITSGNFNKEDSPKDTDEQIWSTISITGQNQLRYLHTSPPII
jgi:hypothetical protein